MCLSDSRELMNMSVDLNSGEGACGLTEADLLAICRALTGLWAVRVGRGRDTAMVRAALARAGHFAADLKRRERKIDLMGWEVLYVNVRRWCERNGHADLVAAADAAHENAALDRLIDDVKKAG